MGFRKFLAAAAFVFTGISGADAAVNPVTVITQSIKPGATHAICKSGGICRKFEGIGCSISKNFASTCALICDGIEGFNGSTCVRKAARRFGLNMQTKSYGNESIQEHLGRQIVKGTGNDPISQKLFTVLCSAVGKSLTKGKLTEACNAVHAQHEEYSSEYGEEYTE
ncbi:hypothetical protein [Candidatus Odyssella acanthamoebae]|uniref:Novel toxin 16 domain-containing protein n=1 Tax=Candidatus Odyssella acanthamoebae TaxID=91604 RepID=A0A077ATU4_9PROT|nr:hypothetical protein [Candidatus Paracaedibacter acanthamoebae]AIK95816.1 hypothetical protein ID47_02305 [Candidatus Paracaedibacter acanthamoebae]